MRQNFRLGMAKQWKEDNSPLTATDLAVNRLVLDAVKQRFPQHGVLAEEESSVEGSPEYVWVCDPVDGTIPFSHGVPTSVFSLALTRSGESLLGVAYDFALDRMLTAQKGGGAFLNAQPIKVSVAGNIKATVVNLDGPWSGTGYAGVNLFALPAYLTREKAKMTKFSCIAYGGMLVALGEFSAAVCMGKYPWDVAALKVIVEEAGGKVTDLHGHGQRYDREIRGALITNGHVHESMLALITKAAGSPLET